MAVVKYLIFLAFCAAVFATSQYSVFNFEAPAPFGPFGWLGSCNLSKNGVINLNTGQKNSVLYTPAVPAPAWLWAVTESDVLVQIPTTAVSDTSGAAFGLPTTYYPVNQTPFPPSGLDVEGTFVNGNITITWDNTNGTTACGDDYLSKFVVTPSPGIGYTILGAGIVRADFPAPGGDKVIFGASLPCTPDGVATVYAKMAISVTQSFVVVFAEGALSPTSIGYIRCDFADPSNWFNTCLFQQDLSGANGFIETGSYGSSSGRTTIDTPDTNGFSTGAHFFDSKSYTGCT